MEDVYFYNLCLGKEGDTSSVQMTKLDQLKLAFFFYFRRIFWTQTQQGSQSHQAWICNYDFCENAQKKMKTPSVPHLPREVHHFVHCRQEEPGREDFKPAK